MERRTIIVGDIHGCLAEFDGLLAKTGFDGGPGGGGTDRLILVGDLINKGPDSLGVLARARGLGCEVVLGNHEWNFIRSADGVSGTGRASFERLRGEMGASFGSWLGWLRALPTFIEDEDFLVVHAGLAPGRHPRDTEARILTRIRTWDGVGRRLHGKGDPPWFDLYEGEKLVVFGHWAALGLMERPNAVCLDSGCVYGKRLSALVLPGREVVQVEARRTYEKAASGPF